MKPNIKKYNPDPEYIKSLIRKSGYKVSQVAKMMGISERSLHDRLNDNHPSKISYENQFFIEHI